MKKITTVFFALAIFCAFQTKAQQTVWNIDKAHSKIQFEIDHMVISEVTGQFKEYMGTVLSDKPDFSDLKVNATIQVNSISTDNDDRDKHLVGEDFFNAAKYPTITFEGTSMQKKEDNKYKLTGNLTIHGVTKPVTLDVKYNGTQKDPWGNIKAGFKVTGKIKRKDFGLTYNSTLETGGLLIGEEVEILINVELAKEKK